MLNGETTTQEVCIQSAGVAFPGMDPQNVVCSPAAVQTLDDVFMDGRVADMETKVRNHSSCLVL